MRSIRDRDRVQFRVADTGIGIEVEDVSKIVNEFEQIKEADTGQFDGSVWVSVSLEIPRLMNGEICVDSDPGRVPSLPFGSSIPAAPCRVPGCRRP